MVREPTSHSGPLKKLQDLACTLRASSTGQPRSVGGVKVVIIAKEQVEVLGCQPLELGLQLAAVVPVIAASPRLAPVFLQKGKSASSPTDEFATTAVSRIL